MLNLDGNRYLGTYADAQAKTHTHRHALTQSDTERHRATPSDTERHRQARTTRLPPAVPWAHVIRYRPLESVLAMWPGKMYETPHDKQRHDKRHALGRVCAQRALEKGLHAHHDFWSERCESVAV